MSDMAEKRGSRKGNLSGFAEIGGIYDRFAKNLTEKKHKSPTKRLINQKNSITKHKTKVQTQLKRGNYSQIYSVAPGNTYVIEAQGGELPYDLAEQEPLKFYNLVLHQDIKRCHITNRGRRLFFVWTQRPMLKIISSVKNKLVRRMSKELGRKFEKDIENAVNSAEIEEDIKQNIESGAIELTDEYQRPLLQQQLQNYAKMQQKLDS